MLSESACMIRVAASCVSVPVGVDVRFWCQNIRLMFPFNKTCALFVGMMRHASNTSSITRGEPPPPASIERVLAFSVDILDAQGSPTLISWLEACSHYVLELQVSEIGSRDYHQAASRDAVFETTLNRQSV
jgi:hypothetical protein